MILSNIFQQKFPLLYFDEGFYADFLPKILNAMKNKKKDNIAKEQNEKKYYNSLIRSIAQGEEIYFDDIEIYDSDVEIFNEFLIEEIKNYLPDDLQHLNLEISIINFVDGNLTILPISETPGLYLKKSILPIVYQKIPLLPLEDYNISDDNYLTFCFESGVFRDESTIDEITVRFKALNQGSIDEDGFDLFLLCAEQLLKINIIVVSNKFIGCDNCKKYFFTSSIPERQIQESRPSYFIYRFIDDTDSVSYYKIEFVNIDTKKIVSDYSDFSIKRLIRKYKENFELNEISQVYMEPTDIDRDLPIIRIEIEQKEIKLMLGSTYNLYTLDHKLVGKIDVIDIKNNNGICNIHWIDKYPQKLL
jgi:hypothetical protein